jgi:hypothetical protein
VRELILRIHPKGTGGAAGYPLELLAGEIGDPAWRAKPRVATELAADLPIPPPPAGAWPTLAQIRALVHGDPPANQNILIESGRALAALVGGGGVAEVWTAERKMARAAWDAGEGTTLRIVLDIRAPDLRAIPWELLRHELKPTFQARWGPVTRWHEAAYGTPECPAISEPLRVLVVVGCREKDDQVQWRDELHHILAITSPRLHRVDHEIFLSHRVKEGDLLKQLRSSIESFAPHVVHFIGHGRAKTKLAQAALELWDATDADANVHAGRPWGQTDIAGSMDNALPKARLVVLNACRTAEFGEQQGLWGMAEALLDVGVAAVVGMQGDIPGKAAADFAAGFYGSLLSGTPVDQAMVAGRESILGDSNDWQRDWALPMLMTSVAPDDVLPLTESPAQDAVLSVKAFVDRRDMRRHIRKRAEGPAVGAAGPGLLVVRGNGLMGKSLLVRACLEGCHLRGRRVRYVTFDGHPTLNIIEVLRLIRGPRPDPAAGDPDDGIANTLYPEFGLFNDALTALLKGDIPPLARGSGEDDPPLRYVEGKAHEKTLELAFAAFRSCLVNATRTAPLILALDQLGRDGFGIATEAFAAKAPSLVTELLKPINDRAQTQVGDVRCVIAASTEQVQRYQLATLAADMTCVVDAFPHDDWDLLAREFLLQEFSKERKLTPRDMDAYIELYRNFLPQKRSTWDPGTLILFRNVVKSALDSV